MLEYWNDGIMGSGPLAPLPARRAYRPEGRAYASERKWGSGILTTFLLTRK